MTAPRLGNWSQAHQRKLAKYTDQHGRKWWTYIEIRTGDPCDRLHADGWKAPLMPPPKYMRVDPERPGQLEIRYDAWISDLRLAARDWTKQANIIGLELYKDQFDPSAPLSTAVLMKAGPRPFPVEPVQAAKQGNRWVLGLLGPNGEAPKMPDKLAPHFVKPVEFEDVFEDEYENENEEPAAEVEAAPRRSHHRKTAATVA